MCGAYGVTVTASAARTMTVRWSRLCTLSSGPWESHSAAVMYSYAPRSQVTSVLLPSSRRTCRVTSALAVPAAGYLTARGGRSGSAGSAIDPRGQQPLAVGSPPVAAEAVHGLGRDVLREAVGDVVVLRGGQQAVRPVGQLGHAYRAAGHVGHALPRRVDPRVRHRARGRHRFRDAGRLARVADAQHP